MSKAQKEIDWDNFVIPPFDQSQCKIPPAKCECQKRFLQRAQDYDDEDYAAIGKAHYEMAQSYLFGHHGTTKDMTNGFISASTAKQYKTPNASATAGIYFLFGFGVLRDSTTAMKCFEDEVKVNPKCGFAYHYIAYCYEKGRGVNMDHKKAEENRKLATQYGICKLSEVKSAVLPIAAAAAAAAITAVASSGATKTPPPTPIFTITVTAPPPPPPFNGRPQTALSSSQSMSAAQ